MKRNTYVVIGLGKFGKAIISVLKQFSCDIIAIDSDEEAVNEVSNEIENACIADSTSEAALKSIGVQNADYAVIAIGENFEATIMTFMTLKNLGLDVSRIIVRNDEEKYKPILAAVGVTEIISPSESAGRRLGTSISSPDIVDYFELHGKFAVTDLKVPATYPGRKIGDLNLRNRFGVNVLLIQKDKEDPQIAKADDMICAGDQIFVFGTPETTYMFVDYLKSEK